MSLDAQSDPHTVYATVLRGFGLTRSELPPPHDGEGEVTPEGVGRDLVAAGTTDPYERLVQSIAHSEHGVAAPRHYWSEAPAQHLATPLSAFGYEFGLKTKPDGDGRTVAAVLRTDATTQRTTFTYPDDGDGADTYPALVHAIEERLLPAAGPTFVRLADDGDAWRFALVERWRLAELQERFGDRIEVFGDPLLAAYQPADMAGEGDRPGHVDSVSVPTEPLDDAFEHVRGAAVTDPVTAQNGAHDLQVDLDRETAAALRGAGVALSEERGLDSDTDARSPSTTTQAASGSGPGGADDGSLWSGGDADGTGPDRPRKRYAGSGDRDPDPDVDPDQESDPITDRGRFVPSDPPGMGVEASDAPDEGTAGGADEDAEGSARHVAHDADSVEDLPESVTLDRSHATRVRGDGLPFVAEEPDATVLGDDPESGALSDAADDSGFVFGDDRADSDDGANDTTADAGRDREVAGSESTDEPLSQQVERALSDTGGDSSATTTGSATQSGTADVTVDHPDDGDDSVTSDHVPREWAGDDDADSSGRSDGDVLSAITEWIEDER